MGEDNLKIELISKDGVLNALIPIMCEFSIDPYIQGRIIGCVMNCPIAYDVEKVIAELKNLQDSDTREVYFTKHIYLDDAIDVVKNSLVN